jgi:hypothetical protein
MVLVGVLGYATRVWENRLVDSRPRVADDGYSIGQNGRVRETTWTSFSTRSLPFSTHTTPKGGPSTTQAYTVSPARSFPAQRERRTAQRSTSHGPWAQKMTKQHERNVNRTQRHCLCLPVPSRIHLRRGRACSSSTTTSKPGGDPATQPRLFHVLLKRPLPARARVPPASFVASTL